MIRIIVAGDIRLYRDGLALHLARQPGMSVAGCVSSRPDLLERIRSDRPDVVLLDMAMPESLRALREIAALRCTVRVVALSLPEVEPAILACAEAGIAAYVTREASLDDLVEVIDRAGRGECALSPRIAGIMLRRISTLAASHSDEFASDATLTARELEIARLVDQGMSNKSIAARLGIEVATVKNHVHNILAKLQAGRRAEISQRLRTAAPWSTSE